MSPQKVLKGCPESKQERAPPCLHAFGFVAPILFCSRAIKSLDEVFLFLLPIPAFVHHQFRRAWFRMSVNGQLCKIMDSYQQNS